MIVEQVSHPTCRLFCDVSHSSLGVCQNENTQREVKRTGRTEKQVVAVDDVNRWDEKAGLRGDAVRSQVIDGLEAQEIKETGNEEG